MSESAIEPLPNAKRVVDAQRDHGGGNAGIQPPGGDGNAVQLILRQGFGDENELRFAGKRIHVHGRVLGSAAPRSGPPIRMGKGRRWINGGRRAERLTAGRPDVWQHAVCGQVQAVSEAIGDWSTSTSTSSMSSRSKARHIATSSQLSQVPR